MRIVRLLLKRSVVLALEVFVLYAHLIAAGLGKGLTPLGRALVLPFQSGGACLVFACAFAGDWLLRRWTPAGDGDGSGQQHRGVVPSSC